MSFSAGGGAHNSVRQEASPSRLQLERFNIERGGRPYFINQACSISRPSSQPEYSVDRSRDSSPRNGEGMAQAEQDSAAIQALCAQGLAHHQAGRLEDARAAYEAVLRADPDDAAALHLLGVYCVQTGQLELAVSLIERSLVVNPTTVAAYGNLANALNRLQRFDEVVAACDRAIALDPSFAEAHGNRGQALYALGRMAEALASYERVAALKPAAQAYYNQANLLREVGRLDEALASYDRALALKPDYVEAHRGRGVALSELERPREALDSHDQAIAFKPAYAEAWCGRGIALRQLKRPQEALISHDRAITLNPGFAEAFNHRGNVLIDLKRVDDALACYDRAIVLKPDYADAHNNRGSALSEQQRLEEALASFERATALKPDNAEYHNNLAVALDDLRRLPEALVSYDLALKLAPDRGDIQHNQAMCRLALGDYAAGWAQYEWRWRTQQMAGRRELPAPLWLGHERLESCTILLHAEQGLGDTLQFCRYAADVAALGAEVILEVQPGLERLMARLEGVDRIVVRGQPLPPHDFQTPLMSLPLALGVAPDGRSEPYLSADPAEAAAWAARLAPEGLRVGLCWAGGIRPDRPVANRIDARRSLSLEVLRPLADAPGVSFYSLQKGPPSVELARAEARGWGGPEIVDLTAELKDFADTAALVAGLDLVITCDTAVAHLAGALGKPVWILNRFDTCWRWLVGRDDSPWYPSARLFTQTAPGDWDGVVARVANELAALASAERPARRQAG